MKDNLYTVVFIDYGNTEKLAGSRLRALSPEFGVNQLPAQAHAAQLAHLDLASDEYFSECLDVLRDLTEGVFLVAEIIKRNPMQVMLTTSTPRPENKLCINEELVKQGLASLNREYLRGKKEGDFLVDAQEAARQARLLIWQYGDFTQDEE